ncbi:MAG: hypothetical protein ABW128_07320 [Rhizorhabdus sp.]
MLAGIPGASLAASLADYVDVVPYAYGTGIQVRADPGMAFHEVATLLGVSLAGTEVDLAASGVILFG